MKAAVALVSQLEARSKLLEGLSPAHRAEALAAGKTLRFFARQVLQHAGEPASRLCLLRSGRAQYFTISEEGEKTILHWIAPGDCFGLAVFVPGDRTFLLGVEMVESGSAIVWDRDRLRSLASRFPKLTENALDIVYDGFVRLLCIHMSLSSRGAAHRLRQAVVDLSYGIGRPVPHGVEIEITNEELAGMAHVTLFTASRYLSDWQRRGVIEKKRGSIVVRSPQRLLSFDIK
jgi:CRP/FNR family transcriptional regulator, nitrogen oxide reductase regulator